MDSNHIPVFIAFTSILTRYVPGAQKRWSRGIDFRISSSALVLSQLRAIKIVGLAPSMATHLQAARQHEMDMSLRRRFFSCLNWVFGKS